MRWHLLFAVRCVLLLYVVDVCCSWLLFVVRCVPRFVVRRLLLLCVGFWSRCLSLLYCGVCWCCCWLIVVRFVVAYRCAVCGSLFVASSLSINSVCCGS